MMFITSGGDVLTSSRTLIYLTSRVGSTRSYYSFNRHNEPVQRFPRGGKERKLNYRPTVSTFVVILAQCGGIYSQKLNAQAFWSSEFTPVQDTIVTALLRLGATDLFARLLVKDNRVTHYLSSSGPFTVFAPTNQAMKKLSEDSHQFLRNKSAARRFVKSHIVSNFWLLRDIVGQSYTPWKGFNHERHMPTLLTTITGRRFVIRTTGDLENNTREIRLGREANNGGQAARLINPDLRCHNGVIHLISSIIIPEPDVKVTIKPNEELKWLEEKNTRNSGVKDAPLRIEY